jgi:hypothetical protein
MRMVNLPSIKAQPLMRRRKEWYLIIKLRKSIGPKRKGEDVSTRFVEAGDWATDCCSIFAVEFTRAAAHPWLRM